MPARTLKQLRQTLARLQNGQAPGPWTARTAFLGPSGGSFLVLAAGIIEAKPSAAQLAVAGEVIALLADDPKWEVRKAVADALRTVPDESFAPVLARLTDDETAFVRLAAETAIDRRSKGPVASGRRRQRLPQSGERLAKIDAGSGGRPHSARGRSARPTTTACPATRMTSAISGPLPSQVSKLSKQVDAGTITSGCAADHPPYRRARVLLDRAAVAMREYAVPVGTDRRSERVHRLMEEAVGLATDALEERDLDVAKAAGAGRLHQHDSLAGESFLMALVNVVKNAMEAALAHCGTEGRVELIAVVEEDEVRITIQYWCRA